VLVVTIVALALRVAWVLSVPTIAVGDFATYRESAMFLSERGRLDDGFIYMPGLVLLLAGIDRLGGEVLAGKLLGAGFGALTAAALMVIAGALGRSVTTEATGPAAGGPDRSAPTPRLLGGCVAVLYVLWLPGLAMASVVGTDVPCAALICVALAGLFHWGPRRPVVAAVAFGAAMGGAAWFRAVALPLVALSGGYWLALRAPVRRVVTRTLLGVAVALVVLGPWAWRNFEQSGSLEFTDSHGGVTALMGNDPNTEGTYSRGLGVSFQELTGKTFLSPPHRDTDRLAYRLARRWMVFEPGFTLGMIAMRIERLLAPERGLLYWSVYRPGVLPPAATLAFDVRRAWLTGLTDAYGWLLVVGLCAGVSFAVRARAFGVLVPLGFALALLGTYAVFVAEPRYRVTSEIVAFPVAAYGLAHLARRAGMLVRGVARGTSGRAGAAHPDPRGGWTCLRVARQRLTGAGGPLLGTAGLLLALVVGGFATVEGGRFLRDRHRWAFSVSSVDGQPAATYWRPVFDAHASRFEASPLRGGAGGVTILPPPPGAARSTVEMVLPDVRPDPTRHQGLHLRAHLTWAEPDPACPPRSSSSSSLPMLTLGLPDSATVFATARISDDEISGTVLEARSASQPEGRSPSAGGLRMVLDLVPAPASGGFSLEPALPPCAAPSVRLSTVALTGAPLPTGGP
jgi:hypothetical protein